MSVQSEVAKKRVSFCKMFQCNPQFLLLCCGLSALLHLNSVLGQTVGLSKKSEPMFISRSETFKFVAGQTVVLPCDVANTDNYIVAWKRGIAILSAGAVKVTPDERFRLINGYSLEIQNASPQDAGDYICQIATLDPIEITHTVEILVPAQIHRLSTANDLKIKKGSTVRIECFASGNPTPSIFWTRKNNILPNGEDKLVSPVLTIENIDRHKSGTYICSANNGVGQPAVRQVNLQVLYPPEIAVERPVVFSGEGQEAMLVCIVHGETMPEVTWFKETMQLDTTERHIKDNRGSRHTLLIRKVHQQDFGNYSCVAENPLGRARQTLELSGKPSSAIFHSSIIGQYRDKYNISWTVDSHSPVEEFKLYFRRLPQGHPGTDLDNTIEQSQPLLHPQSVYGSRSFGSGSYGGTYSHYRNSDWRDVVLAAIPASHHFTQGMSYMIKNLDPDQQYEARVQAKNRFGWSNISDGFTFTTSHTDGPTDEMIINRSLSDSEMRDLGVTFYSQASGAMSIQITAGLVSIFCIMGFLL